MRVLIATDAWRPQVNGVVRTLSEIVREAPGLGATVEIIAPSDFRNVPMPGYPEIRLALPVPSQMARRIDTFQPDAIHIATEGPIGFAMRRLCRTRGLAFTTSFHTRFPDYIAERLPVAQSWGAQCTWAWLRRFHAASSAVLAPTPALVAELTARGFNGARLWPRGVDADLFTPRDDADLGFPRPVFLTVGRLAVEKNVEAFLSLDLPGSKVVVGDGPARAQLERQFPKAHFLGAKHGTELADIYAAAEVFVFPSRTDTFGLVLLEALASGVPVAAFPSPAPRAVIGTAGVGALNDDLRRACLDALRLSREDCRAYALTKSWQASAEIFYSHIADALNAPVKPRRRRAA